MSWLPSLPTAEQLSRAANAAAASAQAAGAQLKQAAVERGILAKAQPCCMCTWQGGAGKEQCVVCTRWVCAEHVKQCPPIRSTNDKYCVPKELLPRAKTPADMSIRELVLGESTKQFVCGLECKQKCVEVWMKHYTEEMTSFLRSDKLRKWVVEMQCNPDRLAEHFFYQIPSALEDQFGKRAWIATYKVAQTGVGVFFGTYGQLAIDSFVYGTQVVTLMKYLKGIFGLDDTMYDLITIIAGIVLPKLRELQAVAKDTGGAVVPATAASSAASAAPVGPPPASGSRVSDAYLAASVFYLSAEHNLQRMSGSGDAALRGLLSSPSVRVCPNAELDRVGCCLDKAQWLYSTTIPGIHETQPWTEWFLSRVLLREGWTLVGCNLHNARAPLCDLANPVIAPCFALAVRVLPGGKREAALCIRGT